MISSYFTLTIHFTTFHEPIFNRYFFILLFLSWRGEYLNSGHCITSSHLFYLNFFLIFLDLIVNLFDFFGVIWYYCILFKIYVTWIISIVLYGRVYHRFSQSLLSWASTGSLNAFSICKELLKRNFCRDFWCYSMMSITLCF